MAGDSSRGRIVLDLNSPAFLDVFLRLESSDLLQVAKSLDRIRNFCWGMAGMPKPSVISFGGFRFAAPTLHFEQGRGCLRYFGALK